MSMRLPQNRPKGERRKAPLFFIRAASAERRLLTERRKGVAPTPHKGLCPLTPNIKRSYYEQF